MSVNPKFRMTFNLPAQKYFFDGENVCGIKIKTENGKIYFQSVENTEDEEAVDFYSRPRGGYEVTIEGSRSAELLSLLMKEATISAPFFTLTKSPDDWTTLQHFESKGAPSKFTPHMRVWLPREKSTLDIKPPISDEITELLGPFTSVIRVANQVLQSVQTEKRVGRPPKEVNEAKQILTAFYALVSEIMPATVKDTKPLQNVVSFLEKYIEEMNSGLEEEADEIVEVKRGVGRPRHISPAVIALPDLSAA